MKKIFLYLLCLSMSPVNGQELYVFTEPASNMPAHSVSAKLTDRFVTSDNIYGRFSNRLMPQVMFGFSRKFMLHIGGTFSNMHTNNFRYESVNLYAKYRFLSKDEIHQHFRMAVFTEASVTNAPFHYEEISLGGDKSGVELGVIATLLTNKLALSGILSHTQVLDKSRNSKVIYIPRRLYQSINYSLSAGYLVYPREYTNYRQTNLNLYTEILGEQSLDAKKYCIDLAPAMQLIFNSNTKLNIGYRFQVSGNMTRMSNQSWLISLERTFLKGMTHN